MHEQFNFWAGDWVVYDTAGNQIGENLIEIEEDQCILHENWKGGKGTIGQSLNYYNPKDSTWNQLWLDNQGSILNLKGGIKDGDMVMRSENTIGKKGIEYYNEIVWSEQNENTVSQTWSIYRADGSLIQELFKGIYKRRK